MVALPRIKVNRLTAARLAGIRPRAVLKAGVIVPILFVTFAIWSAMMMVPSFRAISVGIPLTDQIGVLENGERVLRPVWFTALPGIALGMIGLIGAAWAFHQYRLPEPPSKEKV